MQQVDALPPEQMARWLRETATITRSRGDSEWSGAEVRVAKHVAFRLEQAAELIDRLIASP